MSLYPIKNVNNNLVNVDGSNYSGTLFTSRVIPNTVNPNAMNEPLSNVQAAASYIPCSKGGKRINRKKINKISRIYKMKKSRKGTKRKNRVYSRFLSRHNKTKKGGCWFLGPKSESKKGGCWFPGPKSKSKKGGCWFTKNKKSRSQKGGAYSQYMNNSPITPTYSVGGQSLSSSLSALANPPPYKLLSNCTNCVDNYNHFKNWGFPSKGSY
jgi:hypothetical protein